MPGGHTGDFNADGFADLAIGAPFEDLGSGNSIKNAGAVSVIYGSATGLSSAGNQLWTEDAVGIDPSETGDQFGKAITVGDFNGDGVDDLAIGAPFEDIGTAVDTGAVTILYGTAGVGLTSTNAQFVSEQGLIDGPENGDQFGASLAAGDFNGDLVSDLGVGVPGEDLVNDADAGAVDVLYGVQGTGLTTTGNQIWSQASDGIIGERQPGDRFGFSMTAADFGNGPEDDLAIGSPYDSENAIVASGSVNVIYGSPTGLTSTGNQRWLQDSPGVIGASETGDHFGWDVAAAEMGNGAGADLAVGVPGEDLGSGNSIKDAGAVTVLYGSPTGITSVGNQFWNQNSTDVLGDSGTSDQFGTSLAAADLGNTAEADLAVGVPGDKVGTKSNVGAVNVLYGSPTGLLATGNQLWSQDSAGVMGVAEAGDAFGFDLAAANFGIDPAADLAVGVPTEDLVGSSKVNVGSVNVLYGSPTGVTSTGNQSWTQDSAGIIGIAEVGDEFGRGLGFASTSPG